MPDVSSHRPKTTFQLRMSKASIGTFCGMYVLFSSMLTCFHHLACFSVAISSLKVSFASLPPLDAFCCSYSRFQPSLCLLQHSAHPCIQVTCPQGHLPRSRAKSSRLAVGESCSFSHVLGYADVFGHFCSHFVPLRMLHVSSCVPDVFVTFLSIAGSSVCNLVHLPGKYSPAPRSWCIILRLSVRSNWTPPRGF